MMIQFDWIRNWANLLGVQCNAFRPLWLKSSLFSFIRGIILTFNHLIFCEISFFPINPIDFIIDYYLFSLLSVVCCCCLLFENDLKRQAFFSINDSIVLNLCLCRRWVRCLLLYKHSTISIAFSFWRNVPSRWIWNRRRCSSSAANVEQANYIWVVLCTIQNTPSYATCIVLYSGII